MRNPLPAREIQGILGNHGFLRLYGQDQCLYVSDAPRRVSREMLGRIRHTMRERGFTARIDPADLLLIDLQPGRWKALLDSFPQTGRPPFPAREHLHGVYALARLLWQHPSDFDRQPMDMIRAVLKRYARKDGLPALAPELHAQCAEKIRRGEPLPSALANVLCTWLREQYMEVRV